MSRKKIHGILVLSFVLLCMTGCQSQDNVSNSSSNSEDESRDTVSSNSEDENSSNSEDENSSNSEDESRDEYSNISGETGKEYENLLFASDFCVEQPDKPEIETFEMTMKPDLSMQELYDKFDETVDKFYPDVFSAEEKELIYNVNGTDKDGNQLPRTEYDDDGNPIIGGYSRNKEALLNGEYDTPWLWFNSERGMIQMYPNGALQNVTCDAAFKLDYPDEDRTVAMYNAVDENEVVERIHVPVKNFDSDVSYKLLDKDLPLTDAIPTTEQILQDTDKGVANEHLVADVTDAWVVDMGDGIYGYHFWLTSTYNGIRLDTQPMKKGMGSDTNDSNCSHHYDLYPGYAFMIESDKIDSIMMFGVKRAYQIENNQKQETVISYEEAEQKLSESLSGASKIEISRAELVYTPYFDDETLNNEHLTVDAAWKFVAKNQNDGYDYVFYVDSLSGDVEYYTYW